MGLDEKVYSNEGPGYRFAHFIYGLFEKPIVWFRETVVVPNREEYYWYHQRLRRVPTVDQCYTDDVVCIYEAEQQYRRDRQVDKYILEILQRRRDNCVFDNREDQEVCTELKEAFDKAMTNYFIKYGDIGWKDSAVKCFMKQKNRMAWERRHGPVGTGRKTDENKVAEELQS